MVVGLGNFPVYTSGGQPHALLDLPSPAEQVSKRGYLRRFPSPLPRLQEQAVECVRVGKGLRHQQNHCLQIHWTFGSIILSSAHLPWTLDNAMISSVNFFDEVIRKWDTG